MVFLYLVVRDLIQGSDYQFRVCAINIEGEGAYSKESDPAIAKDRNSRPEPSIDLWKRDQVNLYYIMYLYISNKYMACNLQSSKSIFFIQ